jgi:hypothetical protein
MSHAKSRNHLGTRLISAVLAGGLSIFGGCATLAHRSSHDYEGKKNVTSCDREGSVCPWLIGDALLLLPFLIPGVIAFCVDFGTGAWKHDAYAPEEVHTASAEETPEENDGK